MNSETMTLDFAKVSDRLDYDPLTGAFTWKIRPSRAVKKGDPAGWIDPIHGYQKSGF